MTTDKAYTQEDMARAWWEGHMTYRRLGPDNCKCEAWNESECACGEYGSNVITPNPYVVTPPASLCDNYAAPHACLTTGCTTPCDQCREGGPSDA